jgi:hypothetical protein
MRSIGFSISWLSLVIEEKGGAIDESPGEILRAGEAHVENLGLALLESWRSCTSFASSLIGSSAVARVVLRSDDTGIDRQRQRELARHEPALAEFRIVFVPVSDDGLLLLRGAELRGFPQRFRDDRGQADVERGLAGGHPDPEAGDREEVPRLVQFNAQADALRRVADRLFKLKRGILGPGASAGYGPAFVGSFFLPSMALATSKFFWLNGE